MAAEDPHALENEIDSLTPLPLDHRRGLWGVSVLAGLSFVSSTVLLVYLTIKLVRWHFKQCRLEQQQSTDAQAPSSIDLTLGLAERHFFPPCRRNNSRGRENAESTPRKKAYPNQFLVLVYSLLLADIHQASAFLLNAVWLGRDGIIVHTPACWAQGWLVSTGDLSSSCFITAIAVHTYLAVVRNYTPPQRAVYATVIGLWVFNYLVAGLGVIITRNGADGGGLYVRAAAWVMPSCLPPPPFNRHTNNPPVLDQHPLRNPPPGPPLPLDLCLSIPHLGALHFCLFISACKIPHRK